ncbi:MAG TPA: ATP-dependent DNA helicase RecG [Peptococcaceae bacterium]|nr:ATP-dependent DNA helicase RecG [Peptococcaceae bacterium]
MNRIESLKRAVKAEERQGYINTGAIGSFSSYLLEVLAADKGLFPPEIWEKMTSLARDYSEASPYKRRGLLAQLQKLLQIEEENWDEDKPTENKVEDRITKNNANNVNKAKESFVSENKIQNDYPVNYQVKKEAVGSQNLRYLKGVGPQRAKQLENLGIHTVRDLLNHFPRRYEFRIQRKIQDLKDGELATINGRVTGCQVSRGRIKVIKLNIEQENRSIHAVWFNQEYIARQYPPGTEVVVTGKVQWKGKVPELLASEISKGPASAPVEEIVPVYPETAGLNSKTIRRIIKEVLPQVDFLFPDYLPEEEENLLSRTLAYREIHFPSSMESLEKARARLVIDEILFLQLALAQLRSPRHQEESPVLNQGGELVKKFVNTLPFKLTQAQKRVIREIFQDLANGQKRMTRLLQGDVGSGKTVVAMAAILQAVGSGWQAAMMAPTEILAQQHYESLNLAFKPLGVKVVLLVGSQSKGEREKILGQILSGKAQVIVGTHALIQETVQFNSLGLVVTDEQHRFGVRQRTLLEDKGENPHVLVMTATPIPRTLALTLYGDLQLSVLNEKPEGRKPVITKKISERNRPSLEKFLHQQMAAGRQIYVVCPLVEETEKSDLVSAAETAEKLQARFPAKKVVLLHGRMKGQEKEQIMSAFREGEIDILVATTVVEVGVNVPNATVMVIEEAQRFGLAQLHQLRGRVGRGEHQGYCILISDVRDSARLNILCETEDGFRIAEEDLKIRGPGELLGLRQHGIPELKLTDLTKDALLIEKAYRLLQKALACPAKYEKLYREVEKIYPRAEIGLN